MKAPLNHPQFQIFNIHSMYINSLNYIFHTRPPYNRVPLSLLQCSRKSENFVAKRKIYERERRTVSWKEGLGRDCEGTCIQKEGV